MDKDYYMLVNSKVLPEVFKGVILAKELLSSGKASNTSKAVKMAGISRSAYYKYKDSVFRYETTENHELRLRALLCDKSGVFSEMTSVLSSYGANIITVNQSKPIDGTASVTLTVRTDNTKIHTTELLTHLKSVDGIISIREA